MKTKVLIGAGLFIAAAAVAATNDPTSALQRGLFEEEANQNLNAAIQAYQSVANQFDKDRKLAGTAIFRLGECYRKQGNTNDAVAQYERVMREFSDQPALVTLSRQSLSSLGSNPSAPATPIAGRQEQKRLLEQEIKLVEKKLAEEQKQVDAGVLPSGELYGTQREILRLKRQLAALEAGEPVGIAGEEPGREAAAAAKIDLATLEAEIAELKKLSKEQLRVSIQQTFPNPVLTSLMEQLALTEQKLAAAQKEYGPQHAEVLRLSTAAEIAVKQIDGQVEEVMRGLEIKRDAARRAVETLQLLMAGASSAANETAAKSVPPTAVEAEEVKRIQAMIKDSPDLINAKDPNRNGATPLHRAASQGQLVVAQFLLANGADVEAKDSSGDTPLHEAARAGHKGMVELLLSNKANVQAVGNGQMTALHLAAGNGFRSVAETLLAHGAEVNAKTRSGTTPLLVAAANGFRSVAELLLARGADINARTTDVRSTSQDRYTGTALCVAVQRGDRAMAELLLANKADVTATDERQSTPLQQAAVRGDVATAEVLLAHGANVNERGGAKDNRGWTALHYAVNANQKEMVSLLLKNNADPNARMETSYGEGGVGYTPLLIATARVLPEIVDVLLAGKADANLGNETRAPILNALDNENPPARKLILRALLDHGAKVDTRYVGGDTPLMRAVSRGDPDAVAMLIAAKADVNAQNKDGASALSFAVSYSQNYDMTGIAKMLLKAGADPNIGNVDGVTPLHLAVERNRREMVEILLENNANPNVRNKQGATALDYAKAIPLSYQWRAAGSPGTPVPLGVNPVVVANSTAVDATRPPPTILDLLRQHGAADDLPRTDRIEVKRPADAGASLVFARGTNNWNQFTALELFGVMSGLLAETPGSSANAGYTRSAFFKTFGKGLYFPELGGVHIRRPAADLKSWSDQVLDLRPAMEDGQCGSDARLEWGDLVEIPEADHPLNQNWEGLSVRELKNMARCLSRRVEIVIKGQATNVVLAPSIVPSSTYPQEFSISQVTFWVRPALYRTGLLLTSSDLSRVKVIRHDPSTGQRSEWVVDCGDQWSNPDLWLRDGDRIEVPEKTQVSSTTSTPTPPPARPLPTRTLRLAAPVPLPQIEDNEQPSRTGVRPVPAAAPRSSGQTQKGEGWERRATASLEGRGGNSAVWTGKELIVFGGEGMGVSYDDGASYDFAQDAWEMLPRRDAPSSRTAHTAVWTGKEMIVWGGFGGRLGNDTNRDDGARFDPETKRWNRMSNEGAPEARFDHTAIWTGKEMLIWGGYTDSHSLYQGAHADAYLNSGGRYNPASGLWKPMTTRGAPSRRMNNASVWTGKEMLIWGGCNASKVLGDGACYNPARDAWRPVAAKGAPGPRGMPVAVWTGKEMIVWGGAARDDGPQAVCYQDGARYNPETDTWAPMSREGAPRGRIYAKAVWTGTEMLVWGGVNDAEAKGVSDSNRYVGTGARYNPATDSWTAMTAEGAPSPRLASGAWTGKGMLLFGGYNGEHLNETWYYAPSAVLYPYARE